MTDPITSMHSTTIDVTVNAAKEIFEIARDFANPVEVLREAIHNSYDAGASEMTIIAQPQTLEDGRRVLTLEIFDDGLGMNEAQLKNFFSLGYSEKAHLPGRKSIGFKGHGTKIFYQAQNILVATKRDGGELLVARLKDARTSVYRKELPRPLLFKGVDAKSAMEAAGLRSLGEHGTIVRLIDFTPDSLRVIDSFKQNNLENYLRWFTIFGSFEHVVDGERPRPVMKLRLQGTDKSSLQPVEYGHPWPKHDRVDMKALKEKDPRRPFKYFCKTLRTRGHATEGSYKIDIAAVFEGARGRQERDKSIRIQGRMNALYHEEERYGLWLCKDFIPVERKFEWMSDEESPTILGIDPDRALIFVNCQEFSLTANRGSVGNSPAELIAAVKKATFEFIEQSITEDEDLKNFSNEYQDELFSRLREKDKKALQRRIERFNRKQQCTITLSDGSPFLFYEPQREITLFGLISELNIVDPDLLGLNIIDYDDHQGIDLLVRRNGDPGHLLDRTRVAYTELKFELLGSLNHPFDNLHSIICWECRLVDNEIVSDPTGRSFTYKEVKGADGVTHASLVAPPDSKLSHNVKVLVLERHLKERAGMQTDVNPSPITDTPSSAAGNRSKPKKR